MKPCWRLQKKSGSIFLGGIIIVSLVSRLFAADGYWQDNGVNISSNVSTQSFPQLVPDGGNGAIVVWEDWRNGDSDIYSQRINGLGVAQWGGLDVGLCVLGSTQSRPRAIPDGVDGAIVLWNDMRSGSWKIYAQRVNGAGVTQWAGNGVGFGNTQTAQTCVDPQLVSDGAGGAIFFWSEYRSANWDIYAQRVNSAGAIQWPLLGVNVCTDPGYQNLPQAISDGVGGAIVVWQDARNGSANIYAQRVDGLGNALWANNGVDLCNLPTTQEAPQIGTDGNGGAMVVWTDSRNGNKDIYAQRINSMGNTLWANSAISICTAPGDQINPRLIYSGNGETIIAWQDNRVGIDYDIYAQKIAGDGSPQWGGQGKNICVFNGDQLNPQIVSDGSGGAIVCWEDNRNNPACAAYSQRINALGVVQWPLNGVSVCTSIVDQNIVTDDNGGATLAWEDNRSGTRVYGQRLFKRPRPHVYSVSSPGGQGATFHATIEGECFQDDRGTVLGAKLTRTAAADIVGSHLVTANSNSLTCDFDLSSALLGNWFLVLYDNYLQQSSEVVTLEVAIPTSTPTITPTPSVTCTFTCTAIPTSTVTSTLTSTPETTVFQNYIYVFDWQNNVVKIYDRSDPSRLIIVLPPEYKNWGIYTHGDFAYLVNGQGLMEVMDISDKTEPRSIGRYQTAGEAVGISGYKNCVLVANGQNGILIYDVSVPKDVCVIKKITVLGNALNINARSVSVENKTQKAYVVLVDGEIVSMDLTDFTSDASFPSGGHATPNPFLPLLGQKVFFNFRFEDPVPDFTIRIYNLHGRLQRTLTQTREWDGRNESGNLCEGGVYIYQIEAHGKRVSGKVVLIK